jgi:hypothetical protein
MYYWQSAVVDHHQGMLADSLEDNPRLVPFLRDRVDPGDGIKPMAHRSPDAQGSAELVEGAPPGGTILIAVRPAHADGS